MKAEPENKFEAVEDPTTRLELIKTEIFKNTFIFFFLFLSG
jgi:hypothetical protein